ncbi:cytochrome b6f subunit family protein [Prochlorococcus sp. MIT 1314]|uniref:cytochrome b6-f complex subunit PetP n=1 Tax=Prochlorococcus sp. MIT 1314 TaxID=3096220 RepID=UPI002A748ADC|nr:cytochrome b6f subunit family protein [Prochlorococcus sp. MIT 1314]
MSILDKAKIKKSVQVNLELSKDRLTKETIDAINVSSVCRINDFRITDGKGIGVVLQLSNGKEQWFFEDEINLLDENGNIIIKENNTNSNNSLILETLRKLKYENKNKVGELINPINFFLWLIVSFKDIF